MIVFLLKQLLTNGDKKYLKLNFRISTNFNFAL